jgi:hypothetical protein
MYDKELAIAFENAGLGNLLNMVREKKSKKSPTEVSNLVRDARRSVNNRLLELEILEKTYFDENGNLKSK